MAQVTCFCGHHKLDPEMSNYVKDGKPLCHEVTCERTKRRMEMEARRAPFFDDIEHDHVPEPYARSAYARISDL